MAKIKHIAFSTRDAEKTANFYCQVFGLKKIEKLNSPNAKGYYLSDGNINVAILEFQNDQVAGPERGKEWVGLHHIGFQVDELDDVTQKLTAAGSRPRDDINRALGVGMGGPHHMNVETKYAGPDGVILDVSETGWVGTTPLD